MIDTLPRERRPKPEARGWTSRTLPSSPGGVVVDGQRFVRGSAWLRGKVVVISTLDMAQLPDGAGVGPQWHISVSRGRLGRAKPEEVAKARRAFGMLDAEEDNHHPGVARHFWLPVDPAHRVACECKADETQVREADGYTWSQAADHCRGCELAARTGRPCSLHPAP